MAKINDQNVVFELTAEEKVFFEKAREIKVALGDNFPVEPKYEQLNVLLQQYGYKEIGITGLMPFELRKAMELYGGYDRHKKVKELPIEYVYAKFMGGRMKAKNVFPNLGEQVSLTEFQELCIKLRKDNIAMKVNVSEDGYVASTPKHHRPAVNTVGPKYYNTVNPVIQQQINNIKAETTYNFNAVVSSLKEKGLSIEMKDGFAHVFVETEGDRIDAGIIRPGSIATDLTALDQKCLSLGKGIDLSVVINKAGGSNPENNESAVEVSKEDVMTEDEVLYDKIRYLLEDNLAEVEKHGQNVIVTGDTGHMAILITRTMIEFGRVLYSRCGEIFNEEHTAAIRKGLEELFGNDKAKQETPQTETVKTVLTEAEEDLVSEGTSATVDIVFDVELPDGRLVKVTRRTSVKQDDKDPNFLYGYIYRDGKYVGSWIWNRKYSLPVYKPQQAMKKTALGERNSRRLCAAIKKAVCGK